MDFIHRFECQTCGACLEMGERERSTTCAYCASPSVIERPPTPDRPNPSFILGFTVPRQRAVEHARSWIRRALLAPQTFRRAAVQATRGVYVPAYLYTTAAYSRYRAEIGEAYEESETVETTDREGRKVTETRTVTRYDWHTLAGEHAVYINDHVVTASRGLPDEELQAITPFDLRSLQRFSPMIVSGFAAEDPSLDKHQSLQIARTLARKRMRRRVDRFLPGDRKRLLDCDTELHDEHLELAMLPVWILPVRYESDRPAVRLVVNGQTGRVWGRAPVSFIKVAMLAMFAISIALLVYKYIPQVL